MKAVKNWSSLYKQKLKSQMNLTISIFNNKLKYFKFQMSSISTNFKEFSSSDIIKKEKHKESNGKIYLIIGPMFSGKSTELIRNIKRFKIKKLSTAVVSTKLDNRFTDNDSITTHDNIEYPAFRCEKIYDLREKLLNFDVIAIDEGQFYSDIVEESELLANMGKIVIISALSGNFKREPFEVISRLISKSDSIQNLNAICYFCNDDANFSLRITNQKEEIVVGGDNIYKPACRSCFNKLEKTKI